MKAICSLILASALSTSAFAGTDTTDTSKSSKFVQPVASPPDCFAPGFAVSAFGGALLPSHEGHGVGGGGVQGEYFFTEMFGFMTDYGVYATHSEHHQFDGDLVLRFPIHSCCVAPYLMAGGGLSTNATTEGDFNAGAGIEWRFGALKKTGIFLDGMYHFHGRDSDRDFTITRLGVKFAF